MTAPYPDAQDEDCLKPLLICFSQLRWGFVFQRPQHLMTRAAETYRVMFWEEPLFEPGVNPHLSRFRQTGSLEVVTPRLPLGMPAAAARETLRKLFDELVSSETKVDVAWYITPMMLSFTDHLDGDVIVYDNMDELSAFQGAPKTLLDSEIALLKRADVVFTGGMSIFEAKRHRHHNIHPFPSGIDRDHFAQARSWSGAEPSDQASIGRPRVGWFGVIDERMDLDLVQRVAELRPDFQFVMVGPVVKIDPASLPQRTNIHWLGAKSYDELPAYLAGWDAGFIPFAINESTRFISPTKTPEYLAAGVQVVATPIRDIVRPYGDAGLVAIASTAEQAASALDRCVSGDRTDWLSKADAFIADKSWDGIWAGMSREIDAILEAKQHQVKVQRAG